MTTEICAVNSDSLAAAKKILQGGGVVAFPTETVYGLGGDARNDEAVQLIYRVKGRPSDNPLIVHIHSEFDLSSLVYDAPYADKLRQAFLPGPLTLVYKSKNKVSKLVSCGLDTLAIRVPAHKGAQEFLRYVDMPIAAPSANLSKHISPVSAEHVYSDLSGKIPLILDGGICSGGIESTVCDVTGEFPVVLREGLISKEMIESVAGKCEVYKFKEGEQARSPGMRYKHYAPRCATRLFEAGQIEEAKECFAENHRIGKKVYVLCEDRFKSNFPSDYVLNLGRTEYEIAANLYAELRKGEAVADLIIAIKPEKKDGIMAGVLNRLSKACANE